MAKHKQTGVVAIEFALGLLAFLGMIFYWIEVSYLGFVSSVVDYAVVEASRVSRHNPDTDVSDSFYTDKFKGVLDLSGSLWAHFLDVEEFTVTTSYYTSVEALENKAPVASPKDAPLAIYRLSYPYQPLFMSLFLPEDQTMNITREVIAVQEYERSKFE